MKVPIDVRCLECRQIFCCADCRRRHEANVHQIAFDCLLCRYSSFTLNLDTPPSGELIDHIKLNHLPLHCVKCEKVFQGVEDFLRGEYCEMKKNDERENDHDSMCAMSATIPDSIDNLKKKFPGVRKSDKSAVMTSTPTHPNTPNWGIFQKSFTSTLSGINSPDSDVVQSPPNENEKVTSTTQLSSIQTDSSSKPQAKELKGIMSKGAPRLKLEPSDSLEKPNTYGESPPNRQNPCDDLTNSPNEGGTQDFTPSIINSSDKRKRVTFADEVEQRKQARIKPYSHVFLKPRRPSTPGRIHPKRTRTPRLQAIINNFESRSSKFMKTPKHIRNTPTTNDTTPPSTEQNAVTARTINFKQESPATSDDLNDSPKQDVTDEKDVKCLVTSPSDSDTTNIEHYKSCLQESLSEDKDIKSAMGAVQDLPQQIADSIQESLSSALESQDYSTEIQFKIVITKKVVTIKETTKAVGENAARVDELIHFGKNSTTIWSRLMSGMKWVIWGDKDIINGKSTNENDSPDALLLSSSKRKRFLSELSESPINNKRYRYSERINGRRPLDRMLKGGMFCIERSNSTGADILSKRNDDNKSLNQSF
ncbi:female sterile (1) Young arrest [Arctopsyche grandis]|uniref:female sterile (1) Young arrest n=1 Tax=Arctopsyche grandis TaxID=121162 RepID=UPI00406D9AFA